MMGMKEREFIARMEEELHNEIEQKAKLQGLSKEEFLQKDPYMLGRLLEQNKVLNGLALL